MITQKPEAAKNLNGASQDGAWQDLASMERLIFLMARPISRHSTQQSLNLPPGYERFIWVPLLDVMLPEDSTAQLRGYVS